jgi:hypothetical protein
LLAHEGRSVGAGELQALNVVRTVASNAQRAAVAEEGAIWRVVVYSVQPADNAAAARMLCHHRICGQN